MTGKIQKWILFAILMAFMLLPFIQYQLEFIKFEPLDGAFEKSPKPDFKSFSWNSWFDEKFQNDFNKGLEDNIGFKNFLVRLNNQLDYTFFRRTTTLKAIIGKSDCLYEEGYILDYTGKNFVGKDSIDNVLKRTKILQDFLKKEKNIDLIIVFEPGKASFFPEFIPDKYQPEKKTISNYKYFSQQCKKTGINHLDLNSWFMSLKDTSTYPLFPKYGIHWSTYGMYLAMDTLVKFIEKTRNIDMPNICWDKMKLTDTLKDVDFDIEKTLNLLFQMPHEVMAYPEIKYESDSGKIKPNILAIADSYYWSVYDNKIPEKVFNNQLFWYYNAAVYPDIFEPNIIYVDHTKDKEVIDKQDVILLMATELNTNRTFYGFIENAYNIYCSQNANYR